MLTPNRPQPISMQVAARGKRRVHEADNPQAPRAAFELNEVFQE